VPFPGKEKLLSGAERVDAWLSTMLRENGRVGDGDTITAFLFHRFFHDQELDNGPGVYPHERVTVSIFDSFVGQLRERGFGFVLPREIASGNLPRGRSAILTVDDGYADNLRMLDVLERHRAKAVLFVSAKHVQKNVRFWPDALWIGAHTSGRPRMQLAKATRQLITLPPDEVGQSLRDWFGKDILKPREFIDRPLSPDELRKLARSPLIEIGSHAYDHTTLSPRPADFVRDQLRRSSDYLEELTGYRPVSLAYPNGAYSEGLIQLARECGFTTGFTIEARNNRRADLSDHDSRMRLGRFTVSGLRNIERQLSSAQARVSLSRTLYGLRSHRTPPSEARDGWV
jgi:peptidoglycan/xylan/chitin deacetylase (PgdA/CDA1 family)